MIPAKGLKAKWNLLFNKYTDDEIHEIAQLSCQLNVFYPIAEILYARGFKSKEIALQFLFPDKDLSFYDSSSMKNINVASSRIKQAIDNNEKILICGDYDVDGITGTSLLLIGLRQIGASVNFFLPHRIHDGYGLRANTVDKAKLHGYSLIITVDNGTCAFEALKRAKEIGLDIIVTDHHQPQNVDFDGLYLINPHQKDCFYPCKYLSGVGVVFKLIYYLYQIYKMPLSSIMYELFMIGTIADLVPLLDENRYLVKNAIHKVDTIGASVALEILKENALFKHDHKLTSSDIGFMIAPQINALGRLDNPRNGVLFFSSNNISIKKEIGNQFKKLNEIRKSREKDATSKLMNQIELSNIDPKKEHCIIKADRNFHPGIIGLIAAKLNQHYNVPTCIFAENSESGLLKGSCRTVPACDIFNILSHIDSKIILNFGGHKAAAGVAIEKKNFIEFKKQFSQLIRTTCDISNFDQEIGVDVVIELSDLTLDFYNQLSLLEPFGMGNPSPVFCIADVSIKFMKVLKEEHVKLVLENYHGLTVNIIFFNRPDIITKFKKGDVVCCIGKMQKNIWQNQVSIEMLGVDIGFSL